MVETSSPPTAAGSPLVIPEASAHAPAPAPAPAAPHRHLVQPEDFDAGFKDVPVEYRRGATLEGFPEKIRVRMLTYAETRRVARVVIKRQPGAATDDEGDLLGQYLPPSLPPFYAAEDFLNQLTVQSLARLEFVAFVLAHGYYVQEQLRVAVNKAMETPATDPVATAPATS